MIIDDRENRRVCFVQIDEDEAINELARVYSFAVNLQPDNGASNVVDCSSLTFDNELMALLKPIAQKEWFLDIFEGLKDLDSLCAELRRVAQELIDQRRRQMKDKSSIAASIADAESITEHITVLMRDIGAVGWGNIVDMEETMEKISMNVEDHKGRMHLFDVTFSTSYPTSPPTIYL